MRLPDWLTQPPLVQIMSHVSCSQASITVAVAIAPSAYRLIIDKMRRRGDFESSLCHRFRLYIFEAGKRLGFMKKHLLMNCTTASMMKMKRTYILIAKLKRYMEDSWGWA